MKEEHKVQLVAKLLSKSGRAAAINAMCCTCIYDPVVAGHGSWRKQVEDCTSRTCPLYKYRPCTSGGKDEMDENNEQEEIQDGT